jgi:hypothetical protein
VDRLPLVLDNLSPAAPAVPDSPRYHCWWRPCRGLWQRIAAGPDATTALRLGLLHKAERGLKGGNLVAIPAGEHPTKRAAGRPGRAR